MIHVVLTRSAYGPGWDLEANRRRLDLTRSITARSLRSQTSHHFWWIVLLHQADPLLKERKEVFGGVGRFIFTDAVGSPADVAFASYKADWRAFVPADDTVAMTRLDDDDAFAPWVMERIGEMAGRVERRTVLMLPLGIRVWHGGYTLVRHESNAMHTLVTPPGDTMTVYDYGHRNVRRTGVLHKIDYRPAWLWVRHPDTISGWRTSARPLTDEVRAMFDVDWTPLEQPWVKSPGPNGYVFR